MKKIFALLFLTTFYQNITAQKTFTLADTLRGSITPERAWWDVLKYDIEVKPDYGSKSIEASVAIQFKAVKSGSKMQIDLQQPLQIDAFSLDGNMITDKSAVSKRSDVNNVWYLSLPQISSGSIHEVKIFYHGTPREAVRPPWDGGWIWKKDEKGRPWMSVACQGLGASVWYPCKDHQSDEPDLGASLAITVADTLMAIGNGRLISQRNNNDGTVTYKWEVKNPINNYNIIPYVGKYVNFTDTLQGEKGTLDLSYWVLDYNLEKAKKEFEQVKPMLHCFEYWFGPYPFYEDSYKLIDAPHLGMEHQSAVAYGNGYQNGYRGNDLSGTGWGSKWDFIIVHESGHEWFGNNITTKDIADMWVHEGFTNYSETIYTEWLFGKAAGNEYNYGIRSRIQNKTTITGAYNVNNEGSGDMYYKAGNMLHLIRHSINDDEKFREILRGLNANFYHQAVTAKQAETYISKQSKINFSKIFDQYLRTTQIPVLEYYYSADSSRLYFRWNNCVKGFNLRIAMENDKEKLIIYPSQKWKSMKLFDADKYFFESDYIVKNYYVAMKNTGGSNTQ